MDDRARSRWLLSDAAKPKVAIPRREEPAFREPTLAWFRAGEEPEAEPELEESREIRLPVLAAGIGAALVLVSVLLLIV